MFDFYDDREDKNIIHVTHPIGYVGKLVCKKSKPPFDMFRDNHFEPHEPFQSYLKRNHPDMVLKVDKIENFEWQYGIIFVKFLREIDPAFNEVAMIWEQTARPCSSFVRH